MKKLHPVLQFLIVLLAVGLLFYILGVPTLFGTVGYSVVSIALTAVIVFFLLD